jgi:hypothetical protein
MRKTKSILVWILPALAVAALLASLRLGGSAATLTPSTLPIPDQVFGLVKINDIFVPAGTLVSAWCGGIKFAENATIVDTGESWYTLRIPGDDLSTPLTKEGCAINETISFKVGADLTAQQKNWSEGNFSQLDLSATTWGTIIVKKVTDPDPDQSDTSFSFTTGGGLSPNSFSLKNSEQQDLLHVLPGSGYSIIEAATSGWFQGSAVCDDGSPVNNISVNSSEKITCTFTNKFGVTNYVYFPLVAR